MTVAASDRSWIEEVTGARVSRLEPMPGGGSRSMSILDVEGPDASRHLVLRSETGAGPYAGTELGSLTREAAVYRALAGRGLPVPELVAVSEDGSRLVATRLEGSNDFHGIPDPDEKAAVRRSYIEHLAALHALDPGGLELADLGISRDGTAPPPAWLDVWAHLAEVRVTRPAPVLRLAIGWLRSHAPPPPERVVLCHGDVGPGNFLHRGGAVTGLLDWELCHLGDRHDDLGMLTLRAHQLNGFGDVVEDLRHYEAASGVRIDIDRVRYHRAVALVLGLTTSLMQLDAPGAGRIQVPLFLHLVPTLELLLVRAVAELAEIQLEEPADMATAAPDVVGRDVAGALRSSLAAESPGDVVLGAGPPELLDHLDAAAACGAELDATDLEELEAVLGDRPRTLPAAAARLDAAARTGALDPATLLPWAFRSARRRARLWPAWEPVMAMPLLALERP